MLISLAICTRNRAEQLKDCLSHVGSAADGQDDLEIVVVDNGSTDSTKEVIHSFANIAMSLVRYAYCPDIGSGSAKNVGIGSSTGDWIVFTDDDCYVDRDFFRNFRDFLATPLASRTTPPPARFGSGQIIPFDDLHDPRVANLRVDQVRELPPNSLLPAGIVQGANMFFHRSVFESVGNFNKRMGAGTPFACEDIEMATRASLAGFMGAQIPDIKVTHHHRRLIGSAEAESTVESYDHGRGAYYASLLDMGIHEAWRLWSSTTDLRNESNSQSRLRLVREFDGAAMYLKSLQGNEVKNG